MDFSRPPQGYEDWYLDDGWLKKCMNKIKYGYLYSDYQELNDYRATIKVPNRVHLPYPELFTALMSNLAKKFDETLVFGIRFGEFDWGENETEAEQTMLIQPLSPYCCGAECISTTSLARLAVWGPRDVVHGYTPDPVVGYFLCQECYSQQAYSKCLQELFPAVLTTIILEYADNVGRAGIGPLTMTKIIPPRIKICESQLLEELGGELPHQEYEPRCAKIPITYSTTKFDWLTFLRSRFDPNDYNLESPLRIKWCVNVNVDSKFFGHIMSFSREIYSTMARYCGHFLNFYASLVDNSEGTYVCTLA